MQPELSARSQLFDSLKSYLNNKSRLQPIIGLGSITECVNESRETLYLCDVCSCRLTKADIRNHILGSHHRFNYIKAHHPHSVSEWQQSPDLFKLAWPLMELAKTLEGKEGPGDVQLLEVPDTIYQKIATESENNAAALINALKDEQSKPGSFSETISLHYPSESRRIVLRPHNQRGVSEGFDDADVKPYETSAQTPLVPVTQTPGSKLCLRNAFTSNNICGDVSGGKARIGLARVDELRSDNGSSYGFLCHCCRIRSNKNALFDHLTSYSHLSNYLMETQPDLVDILNEDTEANFQLLRSLAEQVEQQEGRAEPKIVNVPESFCKQITGKSYHWCLRMLSNGWVIPKIQNKKESVQGVTKHLMPMKIPVVTSQQSIKHKPQKKKKKRKKKTDTMFNVRFPLRKGAMLLGRTSFNKNNLLNLTSSPLPDPDPVSSPADRELKRDDAASFDNNDAERSSDLQTSQLEEDLCEEEMANGECVPKANITVTVFQDADGYDGVCFNRSDKETEAEDHMEYGGRRDGSERLFEDRQIEDVQAQRGGPFPAASHDEDWSYKSYYRQDEGDADRWYTSASSQGRVDESGPMNEHQNTTSCAVQRYHHQDQQMAWGDPGSGTGSPWGHRNLPGEVASFIEAARTNVQTHPVFGGSFSSEPGVRFPETDPRQTGPELSFNWYYTDPRNYTTQPAAVQINHLNFQNTGPSTDPVWYRVDPVSGRVSMQPNAFFQSGQAVYYSASSDVFYRTGVPTD